jgi:REP element-mobilizing transposase RayT
MSRPLRLDHAGAVWHVTCRGNEKREIFRDDHDRRGLLSLFARAVTILQWRVHAYVLMGNHYHLLLETPEPNLSRGMRQINGVYTQRFNRRHDRVGHLFQGRFHSILVEKEAHLLELVRYVVLNPVRAGLAKSPEEWPWSNYRATVGLERPAVWLEVAWTLSQFGGGALAGDRYKQFVDAGLASPRAPWVNLRKQFVLGGAAFRKRIQKRIDESGAGAEVPWAHRHCVRPDLDSIVETSARELRCSIGLLVQRRRNVLRLAVAYLARHEAGLREGEFADRLAVRRWAASQLATQAENLLEASPEFRRRIDRIRRALAKVTLSET